MKTKIEIINQARDGRLDLAAVNLFNQNAHLSLRLKLAWLKWLIKKSPVVADWMTPTGLAIHAKLFLAEEMK